MTRRADDQLRQVARRCEADEPIPEDGYHGAYIHAWAGEMPADADPLEWGLQRSLDSHRATLEALDIHHEVWFSERSLVPTGAIDDAMDDLRAHNAVFEDDGAVWLRSTEFGDDKDRVLVKSDGDLTTSRPTSPITATSSPALNSSSTSGVPTTTAMSPA